MRLDHGAGFVIDANDCRMRTAEKLRLADCIAACVWLAIPQAGYCPNLNYNFGVSAECLHKNRGDRTTVCDSLTLLAAAYGACAACDGFGFSRNTATTFDVFYGLQVTNFDVLLNSAPNGPDYIDILAWWLHAQLFRSNVRFRMPTDPVVANILIALPLFEIARVFVPLDHVASFIVNANHSIM